MQDTSLDPVAQFATPHMDLLADVELLWKLMNHNYHRSMGDEGLALGLGTYTYRVDVR